MKLKLSSKANTLKDLKKTLNSAEVLPLVKFQIIDYLKNDKKILNNILKKFSQKLIVRSSSISEDKELASNAGKFKSVLNVKPNQKDIKKAIDEVIKSYGKNVKKKDEVFVQPLLKNVLISGVVFTADQDTLSPYYIINYDTSGSTTGVTHGNNKELKTLIVFKGLDYSSDDNIKKILISCREIENIFNNPFLDIEFAISNHKLYILQVRSIIQKNKNDLSKINLSKSLKKLHKKIIKLNNSHPKLLGSRNCYGVMPDWNPAEIIGIKPKRLAFSLYKEFVTDEIWAYQRDNYGYRNLRSFPLLVSFLGVPYVDVRVSFNSFIPKNLNDKISLKLVEHYLDELFLNEDFHDKIEFEIVFSCYYFGIHKKLIKLKKKNFTDNEIKLIEIELKKITNSIIDKKNGLCKSDLKKIEILKDKYDSIVNSNLSIIDKIYWLTEDCKRYGTLPFAGIARAAFVAIQFLNSFVEEGILTTNEKNTFLNSIETISKKLNLDRKNLSKKNFLNIYGHLRPGTYDICSKRYDEGYDEYFSEKIHEIKHVNFEFSKKQRNQIQKLINLNGLNCDFYELIDFIKSSIEGREYSKFIFTKHLSKILSLIEEFGFKFGFSKEDLANLDFQKIKNLYSTLDHRNVSDIFDEDIKKNKNFYKYTTAVKLPNQISSEEDIYKFFLRRNEANFVTNNNITAKVLDLDFAKKKIFQGRIICIKSADPGYDYIFSKNIRGLITCYGGANSHMSIRCAELGLPAVIGCGEYLFDKYKKANLINIDAANKKVTII